MSKLPENLEENTIANMLPGDMGYTVPWAMWADRERDLWIHGGYTIDDAPHRTSCMKIRRTAEGVDVFADTIGGVPIFSGRAGFYRWRPTVAREASRMSAPTVSSTQPAQRGATYVYESPAYAARQRAAIVVALAAGRTAREVLAELDAAEAAEEQGDG